MPDTIPIPVQRSPVTKMNRYVLAALALILLGFLLVGPPQIPREDWWRKDLHFLAKQLPERHVNLFFKMRREEFDRAVNELDAAIPSLQDHEIVVGMKKILTMIGDPHTDIAVDFSYFPLRLQWFKDGYFVTTTTSANRRTLGSRLVRIGNVDIEKAYAALGAVIPHDNEYWLRTQSSNFLVAPAILHALKLIPQMEKAHFYFEDATRIGYSLDLVQPTHQIDQSEWIHSPDETKVPPPLYLKKRQVYYWFQHLKNSRDLYFQYNRCEEMENLPFSKFAEQLFSLIDNSSVNRLIIDLRHNSGGNSGILWPFIMELKDRPNLNQKGRLFVMIGTGTYSSAVLNAAELQQETRATFVGEPTGARPNLYGQYKHFNLPNSNLSVSYSTQYFERVKDNPPPLCQKLPFKCHQQTSSQVETRRLKKYWTLRNKTERFGVIAGSYSSF